MIKNPACIAGEPSLIPGSKRCPREGSGNPRQYSCLENPMDREGQATVHGGHKESDTTHTHTHTHTHTQCPTTLMIPQAAIQFSMLFFTGFFLWPLTSAALS